MWVTWKGRYQNVFIWVRENASRLNSGSNFLGGVLGFAPKTEALILWLQPVSYGLGSLCMVTQKVLRTIELINFLL